MTNFQKLTPVIPTKAIARGGIFGIHTTVAVTKDPSTNARDDFFVIPGLTRNLFEYQKSISARGIHA